MTQDVVTVHATSPSVWERIVAMWSKGMNTHEIKSALNGAAGRAAYTEADIYNARARVPGNL